MRAILTLLCIFTVTLSAQAQLFGKHWETGYYVDALGRKTEGLISWSPPTKGLFKGRGDAIFYKPTEKADKIKIKTDSVAHFVMGKDSFVISQHTYLERYPVLKVMFNGKVKIYQSVVMQQSGGGMTGGFGGAPMMFTPGWSMSNSTIYYGSSPQDLTKLKRGSNFIEAMSKIMSDKADVVTAIKEKKFRYGDLPDLIAYYETGVDPRVTRPKTDDAY